MAGFAKRGRVMTPTQKRTLAYVRDYYAKHGHSPTMRHMRDAFGLRSLSSVHDQMKALTEYGYLRRSKRYAGRYIPVDSDRLSLAHVSTEILSAELERRAADELENARRR